MTNPILVLQVQVVPAAIAMHIHVIQQMVTPAVAVAGRKLVRVFVFFRGDYQVSTLNKMGSYFTL